MCENVCAYASNVTRSPCTQHTTQIPRHAKQRATHMLCAKQGGDLCGEGMSVNRPYQPVQNPSDCTVHALPLPPRLAAAVEAADRLAL